MAIPALCAAALLALGACATPPEDPAARAAYVEANDPLEPFNRKVFDFNLAVDDALIEPVAVLYHDTLPPTLRDAVRNLLRHLRSPLTFANHVLQGDFQGANTVVVRALVNTIIGFGGIADPAGDLGAPYRGEDFGQTLAVWGVGEGPYLMLPILGPSNPRDATGLVAESLADPLSIWLDNAGHGEAIVARSGTNAIDLRSRNIKLLDDLERSSVDFYATIRSLYRQRRIDDIRNGTPQGPAITPTISFEEDKPASPAAQMSPDGTGATQGPGDAGARRGVSQTSGIEPFVALTVQRIAEESVVEAEAAPGAEAGAGATNKKPRE